MLNISNYQRKANQNYNEVSPHSGQNGHLQKVYNKMLERVWRKGTLLPCWWECKLVQPLWKTWKFLRKLKIELPYDLAIPLLGMYPDKTIIQKDTCTPMFIAALFTTAKTRCCCCGVASVVSDSVRPQRRQPTRLPRPWDSPGKNTGVGCHCLL